MKKLRHILGFSLIIFVITSIHLGYQYVAFSSDKIPTKGGTVVEGTNQTIAYLPYLSMSKSDKWYQHLLFRGCIQMASGHQLTGDLCTITSTNHKNYIITLNPGSKWSDGTSITMNDIYFSYYDVIKSNQRGLSSLDSYNKLEIVQNSDGTISINFPRESVDNQLFFLNPILPAHHLTNQNLTYYQTQFAANPITSACAKIIPQITDKSSVIFDLAQCPNYSPQILQVKQFSNNTGLKNYIDNNKSIVDFVIDGTSDHLTEYGINSTQALISYFHVNTISDSTRRQLALLFNYVLNQDNMEVPGLIRYNGIFNINGTVDRNTIKRNIGILQETNITTQTGDQNPNTGTQINTSELPLLTRNVLAYGTNKYKTAYLPAQSDKFTISFKFDQPYDKVAVSANGPYKYFPESYDPQTRSAEYNLSTSFNNLIDGKNTYIIRGFKGDQAIELMNMTLYYKTKPNDTQTSSSSNVVTNLDGTRAIRIVYVQNPSTNSFIENLQTILSRNNMGDNFIISSVDSISQLEEVIAAKTYEVIIRPMDLGQRNDLSILVHDDPLINNAQYKNQTLKNLLTDLNTSTNQTQKNIITKIQEIYRKDIPFMILGNTMDYVYVTPSIKRQPQENTELNTVRDELLNHIRPIFSLQIDKNRVYNTSNLIKFLVGSNAH